MPIKLKKTNIQYDIETPGDGYIILGFDENGNLVTKNDQGEYESVVSDVSSGNFQRLDVDYLTVGNRVSGAIEGLYSIAQGLNVVAEGDTSFVQGNNASATDLYTYARGEFVEASNLLSHVSGAGVSTANKLISSGINSFVHSYSTSAASGSLADYSAILGGRNQNIGTSANDSAIIAGVGNTVNASVTNSVILGGNAQTATLSNTVYVPRLILANTTATTQTGLVYFDGIDFFGYNGTSARRFGNYVSTPSTNRILTSNDSSGYAIKGNSTLTWNGSTLSVSGAISSTGNIGGSSISASGTITGGSITSTGTITSTGNIGGGTITSAGNITGGGTLNTLKYYGGTTTITDTTNTGTVSYTPSFTSNNLVISQSHNLEGETIYLNVLMTNFQNTSGMPINVHMTVSNYQNCDLVLRLRDSSSNVIQLFNFGNVTGSIINYRASCILSYKGGNWYVLSRQDPYVV